MFHLSILKNKILFLKQNQCFMTENTLNCKNCGSENIAEYCCNCGQKTITNRNTIRKFFSILLSAFDIERGFFYTIKMLLLAPGKVINDYWSGRTKVYYNPLSLFFVIAGVNALLMVWLGVFDMNVQNTNEIFGIDSQQAMQQKLMGFIKQYLSILNFVALPFYSLSSKWMFSKNKKYFAEHLIMNCYFMTIVTVLNIAIYPVYLLIPQLANSIMLIGAITNIFYFSYALKKTFNCSYLKSVISSILILLIGMAMFMIVIIILTIVFIIIFKLFGGELKNLV